MRRDVRGRVVLITGASRGIGKRVAERLAKLGARLALTARSSGELAKIAGELRAAGTEVETFPADIANAQDRSRIVGAVVERFGCLEVLLVLPGLVRSDDLNRHLLRNDGKIYLDFAGAQPSDEVANDVVRSLLRNRTEATSGWVSWGVWIFRRLFPRAVRFFMQRKVW